MILFGRPRGSGLRILLFTLECALGVVAVILVAALAHWSSWLLPVAALLYLLIVVPTALLCGFWQAVIVSLTAVVAQSWFTCEAARAGHYGQSGRIGHPAGLRRWWRSR